MAKKRLQRCPQCLNVGKVQRSRTRGIMEKIQRRVAPWYGIYRCHHCNWRGLLPRFGLSMTGAKLLTVFVATVVIGMILTGVYLLSMANRVRPE